MGKLSQKIMCAIQEGRGGQRSSGFGGQVVSFLGTNMWRVIWYGGGYKCCVETSLKYEGFGPDLVTKTNADWGGGGEGNDYSTGMHTTSNYTSNYIKRTGEYELNVTGFYTDLQSCSQVISGLDTMSASTSNDTYSSTSVESDSSDGGIASYCCTYICKYSGIHSVYTPLYHYKPTYTSASDVPVDALLILIPIRNLHQIWRCLIKHHHIWQCLTCTIFDSQ